MNKLKDLTLKSTLSDNYYIILLAAWVYFFSLLTTTTYSRLVPGMILTLIRAIVLLFLLVRVYAVNKYIPDKNRFWKLCLVVLFSVVAIKSGDLYLIDTIVLIVSAFDINFEKIVRTILIVLSIVFIQTIFSAQIGLIEDRIFYRTYSSAGNYGSRYSLGFVYTTILSVYYFHITALYLFISKSSLKKSYLESSIIIIGAIFIQYLTDSRLTFVLTIFSVILFQIMRAVDLTNILNKPLIKKIVIGLTLGLIGLTIFVPIFYNDQNSIFVTADNIFSRRISLSNEAYAEYGVSLFGKNIEMTGNADIHYNDGQTPNSRYFYLDSSYIYIVLKYGIVMLLLLVTCIFNVLNKDYKNQFQYRLVILLIIFILNGVLNPQFLVLIYNPTIFVLFGEKFGGISDEISLQTDD